jgi:hypothetical protein
MTNKTTVRVSNKYSVEEKSEVNITDSLTEELNATGSITLEDCGAKLDLNTSSDYVEVIYSDGATSNIDYVDITMLYLALKVLHERQGYRTKKITEEDFNV